MSLFSTPLTLPTPFPQPTLQRNWDQYETTQPKPILQSAYEAVQQQNSQSISSTPILQTPLHYNQTTMNTMLQNDPQMAIISQNPQMRKLYVGQVDLSITDEMLKQIFKWFGPIQATERHNPKRPGGFCFYFIQYEHFQSVCDAMSCMNEYRLKGRQLKVSLPESVKAIFTPPDFNTYLQRSDIKQKWRSAVDVGLKLNLIDQITYQQLYNLYEGDINNNINNLNNNNNNNTNTQQQQQQQDTTWKIYVGGGIPSSIGENDLYQLFSNFGDIIKIHLLKLPDGSHKGYGFIDFKLQEDAEKALSLNGLDLLGKKLVVKYAKSSLPQQQQQNQNETNLITHIDGTTTTTTTNTNENTPGIQYDVQMIPFEYDFNSILVPDPLLSRYPNIIPSKQIIQPYPNVKICNLISESDWLLKNQFEQQTFINQLRQDFSVFGIVNHCIMIKQGDVDYVTFFVKFASTIEAKRCVLTINNRLFYDRPITATYSFTFPTSQMDSN